jgi:TonB family protein
MKSLTAFITVSVLLLWFVPTNICQTGKSTTLPDTERSYKDSEVSTKALLIKKPQPSYTKEARKNQVSGTVVIRCVFTSKGKVTNIHVISGLPDGLTERALDAARKIRFTPATKNGHPVSMWMELEYNFTLD